MHPLAEPRLLEGEPACATVNISSLTGPFAGELCALELGRHVNDIDLYLDDGRVATYKVDGNRIAPACRHRLAFHQHRFARGVGPCSRAH